MNIGIVCYASVGGSGVVASELARCLADRGHRTHVISSDTPFRLRESAANVRFHRVETPGYPLFREPQYLLALANRLVQVAHAQKLDIIHAHYAIPHAAAAYLARARAYREPSRRCMAPTSRSWARIRRIAKRWRSASISPMRSRLFQRACATTPNARCRSRATLS
jgi:glycosyltransferase involved in cell wall biosynthesis